MSSQALAQSVFAGLAESGRLSVLASVRAECGRPAFAPDIASMNMVLEKSVSWLAEPRPTSIDVWFEGGDHRIAVECKLTEEEFGTCSRPRLRRDDPSFCNGSYSIQQGRRERCALTEAGVSYWRHLPSVLDWSAGEDHARCPLGWTYQLVRNLLAVMVVQDGAPPPRGHALVVYDARNPAFSPEGVARRAITTVQRDSRSAGLLRTVSWQAIAEPLAGEAALEWMAEGLVAKYGFLVGRRRPRRGPGLRTLQ